MDFDPRDCDSRDEERINTRGGKGGGFQEDLDRDDDLRLPDIRSRDRDDNDARTLGRGPGDSRQSNGDEHRRDPRDDARWRDRDRKPPERTFDPREPFTRNLNLPRGLEREIVRDREYTLRGSETRTLATVGAFRVVSSRDLRDQHDRPLDPRSGDLRHLGEQGLIKTVRVPGSREHAVAVTKEGRALLERHRDRDQGNRQTFWDGLKREREREHDLQVYRAYERAAERLADRGARFYLGTIWISRRADLTPVYAMIFRRLRSVGADWVYHFPQLYLAEIARDNLTAEQPARYSVSESAAAELTSQKRRAEMAGLRAEIDEMNARAREDALDRPPAATVRAYRQV